MKGFHRFQLGILVFVVFSLTFLDFSAASQSVIANASSSDEKLWNANGKGSSEYLQMFVEETDWYNSLVLGPLVPRHIWSPLPKYLQTWLRNYIAGILVYFVSGGLWCFYIYYWKRNAYLPAEDIPSKEPIFLQIAVSMKAMPLELHDIKPLYKHLHAIHHIYNKRNTLSPFAGLAFHPLDGILQAIPHVIVLFIIPVHFFSHEFLLFCEGVWTTNIHDCIHGKVWPVMGAGYHTIHHTTYRHNYGHYTIWMDWMFGTLCDPILDAKNLKEM
ncbi:hypothetical protein SUGI_0118320 [Cryptomeria japonica]|nr:hypothetical protein SUGI_0118320 [Cryptomeria japonica]